MRHRKLSPYYALLFLCCFPTLAAAAIWEGNGRIIKGANRGAYVELKVDYSNKRVEICEGPSQGELFYLQKGKGESSTGDWLFRKYGDDLEVTLRTNRSQTIVYELSYISDNGC